MYFCTDVVESNERKPQLWRCRIDCQRARLCDEKDGVPRTKRRARAPDARNVSNPVRSNPVVRDKKKMDSMMKYNWPDPSVVDAVLFFDQRSQHPEMRLRTPIEGKYGGPDALRLIRRMTWQLATNCDRMTCGAVHEAQAHHNQEDLGDEPGLGFAVAVVHDFGGHRNGLCGDRPAPNRMCARTYLHRTVWIGNVVEDDIRMGAFRLCATPGCVDRACASGRWSLKSLATKKDRVSFPLRCTHCVRRCRYMKRRSDPPWKHAGGWGSHRGHLQAGPQIHGNLRINDDKPKYAAMATFGMSYKWFLHMMGYAISLQKVMC